MQRACSLIPSSMLTVIGLEEESLQAIIHSVRDRYPDTELCVGNYLFPFGFVVSGNAPQVEEVGRKAGDSGAVLHRVRVSGAFHSKLMKPAVPELEAVLKDIDIEDPVFPVYSNVTGLPYASVHEIREGLALQLVNPVQWSTTMSHMISNYLRTAGNAAENEFLEIGLGRQLKGILRRIDRAAYKRCHNLSV